MDRILEILNRLQPETDFTNNESLIDDGILDSFDLITLIGDINEEYDISIPVWEIVPENFNSVNAMVELINRIKG